VCVAPHVIIADDDDAIRALLARIVPRVLPGARLSLVRDGDEALRCYEAYGADLLISDYLMPRRNGVELLHALRVRGVTVPVVLVSALTSLSSQLHQENGVCFVAKPFQASRSCSRRSYATIAAGLSTR
jgi:DNA-binding response OmpR family regulator